MNNGAAGEVEGAPPVQPQPAIISPYPMGQGRVHDGRPDEDEDEEHAEFHALGECPGDEGRRDYGKLRLKDHEGLMRNLCIKELNKPFPEKD